MAQAPARSVARTTTRASVRVPRYPRNVAPPVLVEVRRGSTVESRHRGHVVQVDADGRIERGIGNPEVVVNLRSAVKPFGLLALMESGAADALKLNDAELAVMAASHSGEDAHVRTLQQMFRRANVSQSMLACGTEGAPMDRLTAARLARDGEEPSPIRHQCSGFHAASLLLSRHKGWSLADYWRPDHPSQVAVREVVARIFEVPVTSLKTSVDACGLYAYAFPLSGIARAFLLLAAPQGPYAESLARVRDAMMAAPEMVGGTRDSTDTRLMKALPARIVVKGGAESLRGIGLLAGARGASSAPAGVAIKIEDGDPNARANRAVTVEALSQLGVIGRAELDRLADVHRPPMLDPRGHVVGESVANFELAPLSELA